MIKITELEQTCFACPSQWDGTTDDGKCVEIYYRYDILTMRVEGERTYSESIGDDGLGGVMEEDEMKQHLSSIAEFS